MSRPHPRPHRLITALLCLALPACSLRGASPGEVNRIAEVLRLEAGQVLADVGAGDGDFAEALARVVGPAGHVYATEVKDDLVESIRLRASDAGLTQVTAIRGDQADLGLEAGCCDAILLRLVYHHFEDPEAMRTGLWNALKPGGLIAIVDITPQENWRVLPGVPDRGGHGIPTDDLLAEMLGAGFEFVERHEDWNQDEDRFTVLFRRPVADSR